MSNKGFYHKAAGSLLMRMISLIVTFGTLSWLARVAGPEGVGVYSIGMMILQITRVVAKLGMDAGLLKLVSYHYDSQNGPLQSSYAVKVLVLSCATCATCLGTVWLIADWAGDLLFDHVNGDHYMRLLGLFLFPFVSVSIFSQLLKAKMRPLLSELVFSTIPSVSLLALLLALPMNKENIIMNIGISITIASIAGYLLLRYQGLSIIGGIRSWKMTTFREILNYSLPMYLVGSLDIVSKQFTILMVGFFGSVAMVGYFDISMRVGNLTLLPLVAINSVVAPQLSNTFSRGDHSRLELLAKNSSKTSLLISGSLCVVGLIIAEQLLAFFGTGFSENGTLILRLVLLAQLFNAYAGPVAFVLQMTDHHRLVGRIMTISTLANLILGLILVQILGVFGLAASYALSIVLWNTLSIYAVKRKLGFYPIYY